MGAVTAWLRILAVLALFVGCAKEIEDPISDQVDFSDPKSVLGSVFYAARSGETGHLSGLCAPAGEASRSVRRICAVTAGSPDFASFRANFAEARLNGEPRIAGDRAELKFLYGPGGAEPELMTLVKRDGRWLLKRF